MFVHWGVYSLLGQGEWVMQNRPIAVPDYEWFASTFNPTKFDAHAWVTLAKAAGMKYITITSRHHDGFSMFATRATRYNIVDWTPFQRDPLKELADECRRQGIKLFFYYSQLDWHHPDYWPRGSTGHKTGRPEGGDWNRYLDFLDAQLTELLTNYGPVGGIWFDGMWDKPDADWRLPQTYALIHRLQPAALIIPNHHRAPLPTSLTMNDSWGFNLTDHKYKSVRDLIHYLVKAAGQGANLLLNIGPRPDGTIPPEAEERLHAIGDWMSRFGGSIYGTRVGPIAPRSWGVTTQRGDTVFVHVLDWNDRALALPALPGSRRWRAREWPNGATVGILPPDAEMTLVLPAATAESFDRIIALYHYEPVMSRCQIA